MRAIIDRTNQQFGRLTALRIIGRNKSGKVVWLCCECKNKVKVTGNDLANGHTKSCGCLNRGLVTVHGQPRTGESPTYMSWAAMIARCTNPNRASWENYGGATLWLCANGGRIFGIS